MPYAPAGATGINNNNNTNNKYLDPTEMKGQEVGENYIRWSFITCTRLQV
jgi:hypothetical protein